MQLVVVCQRINADDIDCLAPPTTTVPATPTTTVPTLTTDPATPTTTASLANPTTTVPGPTTAPPTTVPGEAFSSVTSPPIGPQGYVPRGSLPATGATTEIIVIIAIVFAIGGGSLWFISRKKKDIA